jgi:hypothetical protein
LGLAANDSILDPEDLPLAAVTLDAATTSSSHTDDAKGADVETATRWSLGSTRPCGLIDDRLDYAGPPFVRTTGYESNAFGKNAALHILVDCLYRNSEAVRHVSPVQKRIVPNVFFDVLAHCSSPYVPQICGLMESIPSAEIGLWS